jgi:N-acetylmuramic acid 6-phosphate etherase
LPNRKKSPGLQITEQENPASISLDTQSIPEILRIINREDQKVAPALARAIPQIARAVRIIVPALAQGGRLVYLGAGTSGRLGVLDAAECVPTFGTHQVIGVLAGGARAMLKPVERAEDDPKLAAHDLKRIKLSKNDVLVAISASGRTPYTLGGLRYARRLRAKTIALTCNPDSPINRIADVAIALVVGPEVIAGSTRMKAGTAQKLALNMLSTATMVRLGKVFSNWMVHMQLNNTKLRRRAEGILMKAAGVSAAQASHAIQEADGKLPVAALMLVKGVSKREALHLISSGVNIAALLREAQGR